ncbi:hypothetical protein BT67DRAFT_387122 [Trichocladium antarcticum]|uniref:Uncharacterized protein n=1 Tax=Trichocladium antarcticum TaxID=1450529 RepID=A0AAN6UF92_9PEZI|nr:hypothetical protein BT67DRAFT_387122 [Trichocladium antarcticum]
MIPPVDDAVLHNNPEFASLYSTLTTTILNSDGSTRKKPSAKERSAVREELNEYCLKTAREHLIFHAISSANPQSMQAKPVPVPSLTRRARPQGTQQAPASAAALPAPLLDLLLLLPPLLSLQSDLPPDSATLLLSSPPLSDLPTHLPSLANLISSTLHGDAVHLARIANPSTNPSYVHRTIGALPARAASLISTIAAHKVELTGTRFAAATALASLLQDQAAVLAQLLRALEAKHGPIARSLELRAGEAALIAQRQEAEAESALWLARRDTYTPEAARALASYASHLKDARARLVEAVHAATQELEAYGVGVGEGGTGQGGGGGKERVMTEMARVYRDMGRQVEEVRGDLEKLGRA